MDGSTKLIFDEIINEINNLKKYSKELDVNTRGEKIENYIDVFSKNINNLEKITQDSYEKNFITKENTNN